MLIEKYQQDCNGKSVLDIKKEVIHHILANLCKGSENKELYLNTNFLIQDLIANKTLFTFFIEEGFIKGLLDLLSEDDNQRFICVCKAVSTIIAQLKKNASSQ